MGRWGSWGRFSEPNATRDHFGNIDTATRARWAREDQAQTDNVANAVQLQKGIDSFWEGIFKLVGALFFHPVFCFVGFWLLGVGVLCASAPLLSVSAAQQSFWLPQLPSWYLGIAAGAPAVLAIALRRHVPRIMQVIFWGLIAAGAAWAAIALIQYLLRET